MLLSQLFTEFTKQLTAEFWMFSKILASEIQANYFWGWWSKMGKNKKGFLLAEETLKIVVAVIVIAFLIYFLVSIYMAKVNGDKLIQANSFLKESDESVEIIINNLAEGEVKTKDIFEPEGWYIFAFVDSEIKPNICAGKNCLCVCNDALDYNGKFNRQQKRCDEKGACLIVEELGEFENIKITGDLQIIEIRKTGGKVFLK